MKYVDLEKKLIYWQKIIFRIINIYFWLYILRLFDILYYLNYVWSLLFFKPDILDLSILFDDPFWFFILYIFGFFIVVFLTNPIIRGTIVNIFLNTIG